MKFSIKDFFSKCDQIRSFPLLEKLKELIVSCFVEPLCQKLPEATLLWS